MGNMSLNKWLDKINKLTTRQIACIFAVVGISIFFIGLNNPFQGDDSFQIVNNPIVHSIKNLPLFFKSSTFFDGENLNGIYYRPLMTTTFSFIYTIFGAQPIAFHIVQLALYISSAFLLYLVFRRFLKTAVTLPLALIFLAHPLNSQVVYSIPTMQDALFFFFGILSLWLLITYKSTRSLWVVAVCLFLTMLSKESGLIFTVMALLYLSWFDRKRLRAFLGIIALPIILYITLKLNAVGINEAQYAGPINDMDLAGRLFTAPSILLFYLGKFIFPWELATGYYWVHSTFSVRDVLLPIITDLAVIGLFTYLGIRVRAMLSKDKFHAYLFFAVWTIIGVIPYLQIVPLDMTACTTWFYFAMAGLLGMFCIASLTMKVQIKSQWLILGAVLVIALLGLRTTIRGTDYSSQYNLAVHDVAASGENYSALSNIAQELIHQGKYKEAAEYAQRSVEIYPVVSNYINLGAALQQSGDYPGAIQAYNHALKYGNLSIIYENLGLILIVYGDPTTTSQFLQKAVETYPHDFKLWVYMAVFEGSEGSSEKAKTAISTAAKYGSVPQIIYSNIMNDQPFELPLLGKTVLVR